MACAPTMVWVSLYGVKLLLSNEPFLGDSESINREQIFISSKNNAGLFIYFFKPIYSQSECPAFFFATATCLGAFNNVHNCFLNH